MKFKDKVNITTTKKHEKEKDKYAKDAQLNLMEDGSKCARARNRENDVKINENEKNA